MTFDLVTDWINWKQWSEVGGYSFHHLIFISRTMLLCAAVVGTVLFTTETLTIVVKLLRIHTVKTSDIENPLDERQASPQEINGFCEQQESNVNETEQVKKFDETEKSIKEISEEQEEKVNEGDKSPPEKLKDENEEQTKELDEGDKSSPGKVREDIGEQDEELDKGSKSSQVNVREDIEEQDEELDKGNTSSQGNVREDIEEQDEELDEGSPSSQGNVREDIEEQEKELDKRNLRENSKEQYEGMGQKYIYRLAVLLLILTGFFEDFPVILVTFYTAVAVSCGTPARQEVGSVITMVTIISAMMNSLWTMIILFCELCGGQKFYTNISYSCLKALCQKRSTKCRLSNHCCKEYLIIVGRTLLLGFIFLLFSGNFFMGVLTIGHIHGSVSLRPLRGSFPPLYLTHSVPAGPVGPGLDETRDEAMFI